ncbi:hypothetical protein [Heyndrickxia oleronia]|uniref:Uncharacterized protein n=1 Tax=Heyndrickxia oleronia TaxID=38875 RepID=A0AAW6SRH3_9BACI|nr:hypothetical protein [Heyndrickxia oleronia]MDH5159863.1 hypothetical protein [Heyndrickxia oleronia]
MAKLTGVKTVDMVNGEITKVEYNGEHYVKVDGPAQVGDIVAIEKPWYDEIYRGDFFSVERVTVRNWGKFVYVDGNANGEQDDVIPFRKYGQKYSNERRPQVGDRVKVVKAYGSQGKYQNGDILTIKWVDQDDDGRFKVEENDRPIRDFEVELIGGKQSAPTSASDNLTDRVASLEQRVDSLEGKSADETITHNGATYTLVDRKAQPGDVVEYETGFITEVTGYDRHGDLLAYNDIGSKTWTVYGYYQPVRVYAPVASLKVGDYAKVVNASDFHFLSDGDVVEILGDSCAPTNHSVKRLSDGKIQRVPKDQLVRATDEEVAQAKAETRKASFKIGDYARVINNVNEHCVGDIVKITSLESTAFDFRVDRIGKDDYGFINADNIEKLSAEQADIAKWAAIGRKPNEYKKGDIVRVTIDGALGSRNMKEDIGEVTDVNSEGNPWVSVKARESSSNGARHHHKSIELITPVEARFDR